MDIWYFTENSPPQHLNKLDALPENGFIWLDYSPTEVALAIEHIAHLTGTALHERHVDDCLNTQHPCFYDSMQNYDLLIFRDLNTQTSYFYDTIPIVFILFNQLLVTINHDDNAIAQVKLRFQEAGRKYPLQTRGLLHILLNAAVDNFLALRTPLTQQFSSWQEKLLDQEKTFTDWVAFMQFKTDITQLEMLCEEQQDVLEQWRQDMGLEITENFAVRLNDLANHILRIQQFTRKIKTELDALLQLHYSVISHKTNEVVKILTLISAIFMPLTLITGVFGMNFTYMPILHTKLGYDGTLITMAVLVIVLLGAFKWKKWI
jgi:magnesium transporter